MSRVKPGERVGAHHGRVLHQPVHGMPPRLFEQGGVFVNLAAHDRAEPCHDVAAEPSRAHDDAETLAKRLFHAITRYAFGCGNNHRHPLLSGCDAPL
jgi:hypothetical protein